MAIPSVQDLTLPILRLVSDGQAWPISEIRDALADKYQLSQDERTELLDSGQERFYNRVIWAAIRLQRACLLHRPQRGVYQMTDRGRSVLRDPPERITDTYLKRFSEFAEFVRHDRGEASAETVETSTEEIVPPEERLQLAYQELRKALAIDLLDRVRSVQPQFFERIVLDLLVAMGYGGSRVDAAQAVGRSGDGGIDGIIKEDRLGLDVVYLQAKRWQQTVGRPEVQAFAGSLEGHRANKGVFITTSDFSSQAEDFVRQIHKKIVLINGEQLAQHMIDFGIGVTQIQTYVVKRADGDYFETSVTA